jgi:tetratricopeptide (TPR) repeat protein
MQVYQEKKDYPLAAKEFRDFVSRYPKSEHAPKALYNALLIADKADELDVEIAAGEQLMAQYPKADRTIVRLTVPLLATACERAARYPEAIKWYEQAQSRWPADGKAPDWLFNAAVWREGMGDDAGALADWHKYLERYGTRPDAARIAFNAGLIVERQKDYRKINETWSRFQRQWSKAATPGQLLLAHYRRGLALRELHSPEAAAVMSDVAQRFARLPSADKASPQVLDAAAHARFLGVEPIFNDFMTIHFKRTRQSELVNVLKVKNARMNRLLAQYGEVIGIGSPKWSEAAFERLGEAYRNFNKGLLDAPTPRGLDPEQQELYRSTLESQALPLEDKATGMFTRSIEVSQKSGVYFERATRRTARSPNRDPRERREVEGSEMRRLSLSLIVACACAHAPPPSAAVAPEARPGAPRLIDAPPAILHKEERNDKKAAQDFYRRALENQPSQVGAALNLARLYQEEEKPGDAEKVLEAALGKEPWQPQLLNALSSVLRAGKKLDEAEAAARQVLARHPKDADAYRNLAAIEADRGHVRLAETALNNARKLDDKDAGILNSLGLLAMKRDDVAAARAYFEQAAQIDPGFAPAFANLGALALSYRDYPAAERACGKAVQLDGTRWEAHLAHGWALEGLRKAKEARAEFEAALALKPGQEDALYGKALALKAENDLPAALQAFKEYVENPKAAHLSEAKAQIAAIDLRLKNALPPGGQASLR